MENIAYIEELFNLWRKDAAAIEGSWRTFFERETGGKGAEAVSDELTQPSPFVAQGRVDRLLWAYRDVGYLYAKLNPLGDHIPDRGNLPEKIHGEYENLTLEEFGIPSEDLDRVFFAGRYMRPTTAPLRILIEKFRTTYCSSIGVEFLHIQYKNIRRWLIEAMEATQNHPEVAPGQCATILNDLIRTEELEHFLDTYFLGQKRFSLEGSEALIPALHFLVDSAAKQGIDEIVIGTTHRGRLSILTSILDMSAEELFERFDENFHPGMYGGEGDVKYHIGYETEHVNKDGTSVRITLASNSSHLESVDAVVQGIARAKQDAKSDIGRKTVVPVIIHGDAAFSGQGVVAETFNLSNLAGYTTGGAIHIIVNNQIGFTTLARSARSTVFPTDVAKMLSIPIFHVNGDNPESLVYIVNLAMRFRATFGCDCVIDIFCYRRHGHNETDEPSFTQPLMYQIIGSHASVATLYGQSCDKAGIMSLPEQEKARQDYRGKLKASLDKARSISVDQSPQPPADEPQATVPVTPETGAPEEILSAIIRMVTTVPPGFHMHPKLMHIIAAKARTFSDKKTVDWPLSESLALGSLLLAGIPVRMSGQDSVRGTFSQRHMTWWDAESATPVSYTPLNRLGPKQAKLSLFDSPLSEYSVMAFEYGYSLGSPATLTIWEAQFGDFASGGQVVIDNYISSAEKKWRQKNGLVLLLPHGNEGQGPDHSNGHLERFLQLCAEDNLQVCNPTTPGQYFHLLRSQSLNTLRKPLVVMSPKSLLRHPSVISNLSELTTGLFKPVLDDPAKPQGATRGILCSGKIYYDLADYRDSSHKTDAALMRLEQFSPFPSAALRALLGRYPKMREVLWVQEEHENFGAWQYVRQWISSELPHVKLEYRGRPPAASAATGRLKQHREEQRMVVESAFR